MDKIINQALLVQSLSVEKKTYIQIYEDVILPYSNLKKGHDLALQAVAIEAIRRHDKTKDELLEKMVGALKSCRLALGQLAQSPVHYYLETADEVLSAYQQQKGSK